MTTFTDLQIANNALAILGEAKTVSAVDGTDSSALGQLVFNLYKATRNEELKAWAWVCAIKRTTVLTGVAGATGYINKFTIPADSLRVLDLYTILSGTTYYGSLTLSQTQRHGYILDTPSGFLYTMSGPVGLQAYIKYIYESTDSTKWDLLFCETLSVRLATKMSLFIKKDLAWKDKMKAEYMFLIARAKQMSVIEPVENTLANPWFGDRRPFSPLYERKPLVPQRFMDQATEARGQG